MPKFGSVQTENVTNPIEHEASDSGQILPSMSDALSASGGVGGIPPSAYVDAGIKPAIGHLQAHSVNVPSKGHFKPAVKPSRFVRVNLNDADYADKYEQCAAHAMSWPRTRLQLIYKFEYTAMRSRKQGAKMRHIGFDDRLKDFRDWLIHLGPRPVEGWTVHRMDNYKGYQPGNLKWASKTEQTEIRKVTKWHEVNGEKMTVKRFAKHLGITYSCLYKRLQHGWSVQRLLDAQKKNTGILAWQFPPSLANLCEPQYAVRKFYKQTRLAWFISYLTKLLKNANNLPIPNEKATQELLVIELQKAEKLRDDLQQAQEEAEINEIELVVAALKPQKIEGFGK